MTGVQTCALPICAKGELATNEQLVKRAVELAKIATAAEAREILGIDPKRGILYNL